MRYVLGLIFLGLTLGCRRGPYDDLEDAFPARQRLHSTPISSRTIVLVSRRHRGAFNYRGMVQIRLSSSTVEIDPRFPFMKPVSIPVSAISACSASSFGGDNWNAKLLIGQLETEVSIHASADVIDWCWQNKIPAASGEEARAWLYQGAPLPAHGSVRAELSSRHAYDERIRLARLGY